MRISEAIRMVEIAFGYSTAIHDDWKLDDEALTIAILAMKKQEPMKPYFEYEYFCSGCNSEIVQGTDYCWNCGQKLDWKED